MADQVFGEEKILVNDNVVAKEAEVSVMEAEAIKLAEVIKLFVKDIEPAKLLYGDTFDKYNGSMTLMLGAEPIPSEIQLYQKFAAIVPFVH